MVTVGWSPPSDTAGCLVEIGFVFPKSFFVVLNRHVCVVYIAARQKNRVAALWSEQTISGPKLVPHVASAGL